MAILNGPFRLSQQYEECWTYTVGAFVAGGGGLLPTTEALSTDHGIDTLLIHVSLISN